ncbi:MAG: hypothetical protein U9R06_02335 [Patescibacteria group bacterium]|nr:hypothetical protein [Patescibacteria group bacterium]
MDEDIKKIIEENLKLTKEIHEMTKKIKSFVLWQQIFNVIKILIIIIPIVLGIIYLPPLLKEIVGNYQELLDFNPVGGMDLPAGIDKYIR